MTIRTPDIEKQVCDRLAKGESLRSICRDPGMPDESTVRTWVREDGPFSTQYAQARDMGAETEFEALQEICDEPPERLATGGVDSAWVAWQRQRIDTRKWTLARKAPKKYGEKVTQEHTGPNGGPMQITSIRRVPIEK